jgi:hypothetical protein
MKLHKAKLIYLMILIKEISKILGELDAVGIFKQPFIKLLRIIKGFLL